MALCLPPDELWCFLRLALAFLGYPFLIHIISICLWEKRGYGYECYTWGYHAESKLVVIFACPSESIRPKQFFPMNSHTFEKGNSSTNRGQSAFHVSGIPDRRYRRWIWNPLGQDPWPAAVAENAKLVKALEYGEPLEITCDQLSDSTAI